ncbi:MAG TPA: tripartite tricarboxylate transporter substrate binding protein, partial [Burkholderiales bacterium]|nr:tripartite tricarboxylate transporter substrate binding protein [Burkholderiales bacterium]
MGTRVTALRSGLALLALSLSVSAAAAVSFPSKPIRLIVPVPAGAGADFVARAYAQRLTATLGQQVVVDNRGGASGIIAMEAVAKAAPDGYTLVQATIATLCIMPFMYKKLPYDVQRDFAPVSMTTLNPLLLVVHPSLPVHSVKDLIEYARANPGRVSYASVGSGSVQHLAGFVFFQEAGVSAVHVPYKGAAPATVDLIAGQVNTAFSGVGTVAGLLKTGKLRALAITGKRMDTFPGVPSLAETGGPDVEMGLWNGIVAPAHTPAAIVRRLNAEIVKAANSPELNAALASNSTSPTS